MDIVCYEHGADIAISAVLQWRGDQGVTDTLLSPDDRAALPVEDAEELIDGAGLAPDVPPPAAA